MQLVILAAGHGRRYGGLKQLVPVGPSGEAIMDYTVAAALESGISEVVVVVREEIRAEIAAHITRCWPRDLHVELCCQSDLPGTASAVIAAREVVDGPFVVANADDLYDGDAFARLAAHFSPNTAVLSPADPHLLVAFELQRTILTDRPVTRGLCRLSEDGRLAGVVENQVRLREDGRFQACPLSALDADGRAPGASTMICSGREATSMNLWGFHHRMFDHLEAAIGAFLAAPATNRRELLLPEVVNQLVSEGRDSVEVTCCAARCVGITHPDDLPMVREELAFSRPTVTSRTTRTSSAR